MLLIKVNAQQPPEHFITEDQSEIFLAMRNGFIQAESLVWMIAKEEDEANTAWLREHNAPESLEEAMSIDRLIVRMDLLAEHIEMLDAELVGTDGLATKTINCLSQLSGRLGRHIVELIPMDDEEADDEL